MIDKKKIISKMLLRRRCKLWLNVIVINFKNWLNNSFNKIRIYS